MLGKLFWPTAAEREVIKLREEKARLEGRLEKQKQFIEELCRKFPEVNLEVQRFRLGYKNPELEPTESLA